MLGLLRFLARKLRSTWTAFTNAWVSGERVDQQNAGGQRSGAPDRGGECIGDSGPTHHVASNEPPRRPGDGDGDWRIYALRDWWQCGEHWENMLDDDATLPRGFSFKTRAEAEAYRLARPWIHDAYIEDHVSGVVVPPLKNWGYFKVHWAPGKEPTTWPPTPDDYEAARRHAMRDWPPRAGSPYEWVEVPWQGRERPSATSPGSETEPR